MASDNGEYSDFDDPEGKIIDFPGTSRLISIDGVREMVKNLLQYAGYSEHCAYDVGPFEEQQDGSTVFHFLGRQFRVSVDLLDTEIGAAIRPAREREIEMLIDMQDQLDSIQMAMEQIAQDIARKDPP